MTLPCHAESAALQAVLSRLEGVRRAGRGWRARCPACGGRATKVSVGCTDGGAVLLHAFCGCSPASVLAAIGLTLADLFPANRNPASAAERPEQRRRWRECQWGAALDVLALEATIVAIAARQFVRGQGLSDTDTERLVQAVSRINHARGVLRGN